MSTSQEHTAEFSYKQVFIILLVLTVVTVLVAQVEMPRVLGVIVALAIAAVKASFVAMYFMHLRFAVKPIYLIAGFPLVLTLIAILALMPDVAMNETLSRASIPAEAADAGEAAGH